MTLLAVRCGESVRLVTSRTSSRPFRRHDPQTEPDKPRCSQWPPVIESQKPGLLRSDFDNADRNGAYASAAARALTTHVVRLRRWLS